MNPIRHIAHRIQAMLDPTKDTIRALSRIPLGPGDVAVDCGANVGDITDILSRRGATVHAFEPNPNAFARLAARFAKRPHVVCIPKGVAPQAGTAPLFMHVNAPEDPVFWSTGSSLLDFKSNVDTGTFAQVELVDLAEFVLALDSPVKVVKMDIEGVECAVVNRLIDSGAISRIEHLFVETHDHRIPELKAETDALRARVASEKLDAIIDLTWK
ncbi:MAG: FkbM family methyltransferase [Terrimicrobiaceae bacterium]|nr:FkbM family methyltransferase [Terrimicrobiaceae bacterium]